MFLSESGLIGLDQTYSDGKSTGDATTVVRKAGNGADGKRHEAEEAS